MNTISLGPRAYVRTGSECGAIIGPECGVGVLKKGHVENGGKSLYWQIIDLLYFKPEKHHNSADLHADGDRHVCIRMHVHMVNKMVPVDASVLSWSGYRNEKTILSFYMAATKICCNLSTVSKA